MSRVVLPTLTLLLSLAVATAGAAEPEPNLLVRYALLLGERSPTLPANGLDEPGRELLSWDYQRDNAELKELFSLTSIETLQHGSARLPEAGGRVEVTAADGEHEIEVEMKVELRRPQSDEEGDAARPEAVTRTVVTRDDEVLSAPTVISWLGHRAIVATSVDADAGVLYLVVQVDALPLAEP